MLLFVNLCVISSRVTVKQQNSTKRHKGHAEIHKKIKKLRVSLCYFFVGLCVILKQQNSAKRHKGHAEIRKDLKKTLCISVLFFRESLCYFFASLCATKKVLLNDNFMFIAVLRRTFTGVLFKRFTEVTKIIESAFITDFINTYRFLRQKL